jgi:hypothetical protein
MLKKASRQRSYTSERILFLGKGNLLGENDAIYKKGTHEATIRCSSSKARVLQIKSEVTNFL